MLYQQTMTKTRTRLFIFWIITALCYFISSMLDINSARSNEASEQKIQFACGQSYDQSNNEYIFTTLAWNARNKKPVIIWNKEDFSGNGFDPQTRCEKVSPRFQEAYENQSLNFLTYGKISGQPVICTSRQVGGDCDTLLLTLRHQDNAPQALEQLTDIFLGYADAPLEESSEEGIYAYSKEGIYEQEDRIYIKVDIEQFLNQ